MVVALGTADDATGMVVVLGTADDATGMKVALGTADDGTSDAVPFIVFEKEVAIVAV